MAAKNGHLPEATIEAIEAAEQNGSTTPVELPEWGVTVYVKGLKRGEIKRAFKQAQEADDPEAEIEAIFVNLACVTPPMPLEKAREVLDTGGMKVTQRLLDAIQEVSGLKDGFPA